MTPVSPHDLIETLAAAGITRLSGVPCSSMTGLIDQAQLGGSSGYMNAPNEGEALAFAAGVWLGGSAGATICQNSGVGNLLNALTSLLAPYRIPATLLIGWRGRPGTADEPQHALMGRLTRPLLDLCEASNLVLESRDDLEAVGALARAAVRTRVAAAILVAPTAIGGAAAAIMEVPKSSAPSPATHRATDPPASTRIDRRRAVERVAQLLPEDSLLVATTGLIGRECCALADRSGNFYMAGSMGHAAPLALGIASASARPVLVLDGDGAVLMRLGGLAMVGAARPRRLAHLVLDNGVHASTGGQPTLSAAGDLAGVAHALGYRAVLDTADADEAMALCRAGLAGHGPVLARLRIAAGGATPPRIRLDLPDMAARFREVACSAA